MNSLPTKTKDKLFVFISILPDLPSYSLNTIDRFRHLGLCNLQI